MKKYGFIGYGNMGKMIVENILNLKIFYPNEMIISNRTLSKLNKLKKDYPDITITDDNTYLAKNCDKIFIFIETPEFKDLIFQISPFLTDDSHIVHVCAGLSFENINSFYKGSVSQVIPSIVSTFNNYHNEAININNNVNNISIGENIDNINNIHNINNINNNSDINNENVNNIHNIDNNIDNSSDNSSNDTFNCFKNLFNNKLGISLILHTNNTSNTDKCLIEEIFNEFTYIQIIDDFELSNDEDNDRAIEIATILTSCAPAFISLIIDNLASIANLKSENKINVDEAKYMIVKTFLSTFIQVDTDNLRTYDIIDKTSTKKGITEIGLNYLDKNSNELINELFDSLLERYDEVKSELNKNYS
ncbi:pyrroline-5-carboxylate reductase [Methanobrevibacter arboriphilus JCM 13429 = DSM 1125]|uniref:Pyrroline-5-carboxylate reductase n=2 Tax=Methanobrevibacter arboriphilus TaxID=39441 RepID=A0A1V6N2V3_METAZ|nr:pyrroline-5-carboxylate reductase dimerization domain-containing protein [Methanobrevibacter arboriphilus]OQD58937.1 pyrroline-5-carboxylate reductase [Methanobrevibacter arboriphilus JCM 13429 = DSM 1125]